MTWKVYIIDWSPGAEKMFGYVKKEALGKRLELIHRPEEGPGFSMRILDRIVKSRIWKSEMHFINKDGTEGECDTVFVPLQDQDGKIIAAICVNRDITERVRAERNLKIANSELEKRVQSRTAELKQNVSLLSATLEATADGILVVDRQGKIVSYNRQFVTLWRIPESIMQLQDDEKALGLVLDQLRDPEEFLRTVQYLYDHPSKESMDIITFKDGRIIERFSRPQKLKNKIVGRVWSFRDVTEKKRAEENLVESEERFQQMADNINEIFYLSDFKSGRIEYICPAYERIWGQTCESLYENPSSFGDPIMPEDHDVILNAVERHKLGEITRADYRVIQSDGSIRWVADMAFPLIDDSGNVYRIAGTIRDITERKEAERKREEAIKLIERTSRLVSLGTLSAGIAHEIRQPLTALKLKIDSIVYSKDHGTDISEKKLYTSLVQTQE